MQPARATALHYPAKIAGLKDDVSGWHALQLAVPAHSNILRSGWEPSARRYQLVEPEADINASMSNRAGLRSPASAALRMRVASIVLLDCACCSGDNEVHAKSSAT